MEKVYKRLDAIVCCSEFMKKKLDSDPILREKTVAMHNFISTKKAPAVENRTMCSTSAALRRKRASRPS